MSLILAVTTAVVGLSFVLLPELSRPTVPLAVSVPSIRVTNRWSPGRSVSSGSAPESSC